MRQIDMFLFCFTSEFRSSGVLLLLFFSFHSYLFRRPCVSVHLEGRIIFVSFSVWLGVPMAAVILPAGPVRISFVKIAWLRLTRFLSFCDFSPFFVNL
jgi:hypothetical protein